MAGNPRISLQFEVIRRLHGARSCAHDISHLLGSCVRRKEAGLGFKPCARGNVRTGSFLSNAGCDADSKQISSKDSTILILFQTAIFKSGLPAVRSTKKPSAKDSAHENGTADFGACRFG